MSEIIFGCLDTNLNFGDSISFLDLPKPSRNVGKKKQNIKKKQIVINNEVRLILNNNA